MGGRLEGWAAKRTLQHVLPRRDGAIAPPTSGFAAPQIVCRSTNSSCPASCRASTSLLQSGKKDVDGRDKPGHDKKSWILRS